MHLHKISFGRWGHGGTELQVVMMLNRLLSHLFLLVAELLESNTQARGNNKGEDAIKFTVKHLGKTREEVARHACP